MRKLQYILAVAALSVLAACGGENNHDSDNGSSETDVHQQAIELHEASSARAKQFRSELAEAFAAAQQAGGISQELIGLDLRLQDWSKTLVKLPGMECNHAPGEHHHHDHAAEAALAELSWEEILKLQEAINAELDTLFADLEAIKAK